MKKANVRNIIDQLNIRIGLLNLLIIRIENSYLVNQKKAEFNSAFIIKLNS